MSETNEIFIAVLQDIDKKKLINLKNIAEDLDLSESKVKPIVDFYLEYKFIDRSHNDQKYYITNIGKEYLNIKS